MKFKQKVAAAVAGLVVAGMALAGCGIQTGEASTGREVTDKCVQVSGKTSKKIVASSCGVFMVEDELSQGNWNSADVYAGIEVGKTYDFEAYGPHNGFLSLFPNINSATEVGAG